MLRTALVVAAGGAFLLTRAGVVITENPRKGPWSKQNGCKRRWYGRYHVLIPRIVLYYY